MGILQSSSCKQKSSTSVVPNNSESQSQQSSTNSDAALDAMESGSGTPSPSPPRLKIQRKHPTFDPKLTLQRLKQLQIPPTTEKLTLQDDVIHSGPLLLRRLSLAAVRKAQLFGANNSSSISSPKGSAGSYLPRDKLIGLALRKYFRDADSKKNRGYLTTRSLRKALASILKVSNLPSPPDTVTNKVMKFLGKPLHVDKNGVQMKGAVKKLVVRETAFVGVMRYGQHVAMPGRPPILALCASLVDMQYQQRVRHVDRLWKTYQIQRTRKMGYEELHEMFKHLAPETRHVPTIDEICIFIGAIKSGSKNKNTNNTNYGNDGSDTTSFDGDGEGENQLVLNLEEFAEYVLRGMYQTRKAMKTFSSRGGMQAKITRCLNALSEEAMEDHIQRRSSLSRRPSSNVLPDAGLINQFARFEGMVDGAQDAT